MTARLLLAALGALALAGCAAAPPMVYNVEAFGGHQPEDLLRHAASDGRTVLARVHGAAFGLPKPEFDRAVIAHMQGATRVQPVRFTEVPAPGDRTGYRVVLDFNGVSGGGVALCRDDFTHAPAAANAAMHLHATFCQYETAISTASGQMGSAAAPDDPRFRRLVREVVRDLFVIRERGERGFGGFRDQGGP